MVEKTQDMIVRQRRVVGVGAPVSQARPVGFLEPAHDLPGSATAVAEPAPEAQVQPEIRSNPQRGMRPGGLLVWRRVRLSAATVWVLAGFVTVVSAIGAKELGPASPLAALDRPAAASTPNPPPSVIAGGPAGDADSPALASASMTASAGAGLQPDAGIRWFNGRPVRPARVMTMTVTAYSPDAASCYPYADGQTATLHGVDTNGGFLVAADTDVLPFGTMLTVEGYAGNEVVPVLDRGGAIKGNRLDLLFPTHEAALEWGVKTLDVIIWEYADGKPADDPRELRS